MRILVTGGAGFIGSHLCEKLLEQKYKVICVDNFYSSNEKNIANLKCNSSFKIIKLDICPQFYFGVDEIYDIKVDEIYNLACPASPIHYQSNPIQTIKTNICGAINMLELVKRNGAKILQASTSEIYGDPEVHPQTESYWGNVNPIGIRSCYDEGKRCAETLFFDYYRQYGLRIKVARIFNTYGPKMLPDDGRVVSNFVVQALLGKDITIYGNGNQSRSFCYVDDLVEGLLRLMNSEDVFTGPVNLGNPEEISIQNLAEKIVEMTGAKSRIVYNSLPEDDPHRRQPDITMAKRELNWEPKIKLEEGLRRTIEYFKGIL